MKLTVYQDTAGEWRWTATARNHRVVADSGEGYTTRYGAVRAARNFAELMYVRPAVVVVER